MCDGIKDVNLLREQLQTAIDNDIEIIEIEFMSGKLRYRDRWTVQRILDDNRESQGKVEKAIRERDRLNKSGV